MQIVSAATRNKALFQGKKAVVEGQVLDILRLDGVDRFPVSRLVTLWKNNRWRCMITRWCETEIDRATFNISTWDWMASYGIDSVESILCHQSRSIGNLRHLCPLVLVFNIRAGPENTEGLAKKLHQQHTCNRLG